MNNNKTKLRDFFYFFFCYKMCKFTLFFFYLFLRENSIRAYYFLAIARRRRRKFWKIYAYISVYLSKMLHFNQNLEVEFNKMLKNKVYANIFNTLVCIILKLELFCCALYIAVVFFFFWNIFCKLSKRFNFK